MWYGSMRPFISLDILAAEEPREDIGEGGGASVIHKEIRGVLLGCRQLRAEEAAQSNYRRK